MTWEPEMRRTLSTVLTTHSKKELHGGGDGPANGLQWYEYDLFNSIGVEIPDVGFRYDYISDLEMSASTVISFSRRIFGGGTKDAVLSLYFVARSLKCMS